jgi:hypothetical protein
VENSATSDECQQRSDNHGAEEEGLGLDGMAGVLYIHGTVFTIVLVAILVTMAQERWGWCPNKVVWMRTLLYNRRACKQADATVVETQPIAVNTIHADILRLSEQLQTLQSCLESDSSNNNGTTRPGPMTLPPLPFAQPPGEISSS